jgi:hypothetical protein
LRVVGAGFGRTGTASLRLALERLLEGPCYHMKEAIRRTDHLAWWGEYIRAPREVDWAEILDEYVACAGFPTAAVYDSILERYPEAKVVLTVRDPEDWYASWSRLQASLESVRSLTLGRGSPEVERVLALRDWVVRSALAGQSDRGPSIEAFVSHNERVREALPEQRLLRFDIREGWPPLCAFLGRPVPDEPFPHANQGDLDGLRTIRDLLRSR